MQMLTIRGTMAAMISPEASSTKKRETLPGSTRR
jgi:hypothetical protein